MNSLILSILVLCALTTNSIAIHHSSDDENVAMHGIIHEEVLLQLRVDRIGTNDFFALIYGDTLFLPLEEIFSFLKIYYTISPDRRFISGFFGYEDMLYEISIEDGYGRFLKERHALSPKDFIITRDAVFMRDKLFSQIFGLHTELDYNQMSLNLYSERELPAVRISNRQRAQRIIDTHILNVQPGFSFPRQKKWLGGGMADWSVNYYQLGDKYNYNYSILSGLEVLGGDFDAMFTGRRDVPVDWYNSRWRWRYVADSAPWARQFILGEISNTAGNQYSSIGLQITNAPPNSRRTYGSFLVADQTEPDWEVELYINNRLLQYTRADNDGYFEFPIPLLYGTNRIMLRYLGPMGEERTSERLLQIPHTFIPGGEVEYSVSMGKLRYFDEQETGEAVLRWGVSERLTVGGGAHYLNDSRLTPFLPFGITSLRIGHALLISGEYFRENRSKISLFARFPSDIQTDISYTRFAENGFYNAGQLYDEKRLSLFLPLYKNRSNINMRLNGREVLFSDQSKFLFGNAVLFFRFGSVQSTLSTNITRRIDSHSNIVHSNIRTTGSIAFRVLDGSLVRLISEYNYDKKKIDYVRAEIHRRIFNTGSIRFGAYQDLRFNRSGWELQFRFNLPYLQSVSRVSGQHSRIEYHQFARGTIGYDGSAGRFIADRRNWVRSGAVTVIPFLDIDGDGVLNDNDRILHGKFDAHLEQAMKLRDIGDSHPRFVNILPYDSYVLRVDPYSFPDPLMRPKYEYYSVTVDPNQFKKILIPVYLTSVIQGTVKNSGKGAVGIGRVPLVIESKDRSFSTKTNTFSDGGFYKDGLLPDSYLLYVDPDYLAQQSVVSSPDTLAFEISNTMDITLKDNLHIVLMDVIETHDDVAYRPGILIEEITIDIDSTAVDPETDVRHALSHPDEPESTTDEYRVVQVQPGDNLWSIAGSSEIYGSPTLWIKIWMANRDKIKNPDLIYPGQELRIPPEAPLTRDERLMLKEYHSNR
jgi:hypothetical protein